MSTDAPDQLADGPDQEPVLLPTRAPRSRYFHQPRANRPARAVCGTFDNDGQLVPRWAAEDDGRRPCPTCFPAEVTDDT